MNSSKTSVKAIVPKKYFYTLSEVYFTLRGLLYTGNKFVCPCCGGHFSKFLTCGVIPRANAQCPKCGSLERHRLLWLYLKNKTNLFNEKLKVLHIAPEKIFQKTLKSLPNLDYTSADLSADFAMIKMDITSIQYEDNHFDVILCNHVLEHVMDDQKAMKELLRVLKPGGWAILQVPTDTKLDKTFEDPQIVSPEERERSFGRFDHVRVYGRDYGDRLEQAGFTVKVDDYVRELEDDTMQRYRLASEDIYFCSKN